MSALSPILRKLPGGLLSFWCPGCEDAHVIKIEGPYAWVWNGNAERPTFTPSIKVTTPNEPYCHSYVTDGQIQFLTDCSHAMAGRTVPIPPWPAHVHDGDPA